jgi:hypothetical protein
VADPLHIAEHLAQRLGEIDGIEAVVLGGSRARGAERPDSDVDLGLYYLRARPPSLDALSALARELDDRRDPPELTPFGAWGPFGREAWANGGGWLIVDGVQVDWIYRDLDRVAEVIDACRRGEATLDYFLGYPHGFHSHIYLAEVHYCRPLFERSSRLTELKRDTTPYPAPLQLALVRRFLFDAAFALDACPSPAARGDVFKVAGELFRVAASLVQVLYALNERYFTNEKGAVDEVDGLDRVPDGFARDLRTALAAPGESPRELGAAVDRLRRQLERTRALCVEHLGDVVIV